MRNIRNFFANLWKDESGQGTAEYVLLLLVIVAVVVLFKDKIKTAVSGKMDQTAGKITDFAE